MQLRRNTTYNVQMPASDWLTEASTKAVSAYTHYFTVAPNDSYDGREAQIVFTEKDGKTTQAVTIYQAPSNALGVARTACKMCIRDSTYKGKRTINLDSRGTVYLSKTMSIELGILGGGRVNFAHDDETGDWYICRADDNEGFIVWKDKRCARFSAGFIVHRLSLIHI